MRFILPIFILLSFSSCTLSKSGSGSEELSEAEAWARLSLPSENHNILGRLTGNFDVEISFWSRPEMPPFRSDGTSTLTPILGGRFIEEKLNGKIADQQFEGVGLYGYDNAINKFSNMWADSLNTSLITSSGDFNSEKNEITFKGEVFDPILSETKEVTTVVKFLSEKNYSVALYEEGKRGLPWKTVEMIYRKKAV